MKLKQRTKRELIRRTEGVISLLLVLLLVPFYSVAAILMEVGRFQNAYRGLDDAIGSSEVSVLAQYDEYIKERFGLLAVSQDIDIDTQFNSYLQKQDTQDTRSFSVRNGGASAEGVYPLADIETLRQQIMELSAYTVPAKLFADIGDFSSLMSQLESYNTMLSNFTSLLSGVSTGLEKGMQSYNAQAEAKKQMKLAVDSTKKYNQEAQKYTDALTELKNHLGTVCPEDEEGALAWKQTEEELRQKASEAGASYEAAIKSTSSNVSGVAKKVDDAVAKETSAFDSVIDVSKNYISAGTKNENEKLDEAKKETDEIIANDEISKEVGYTASDMKAANDKVKDFYSETADNLKTGGNANDKMKDYNSEACKKLLTELDDEKKLLSKTDYSSLTEGGIDELISQIHTADTGKFESTQQFDEIWKDAKNAVEGDAAKSSIIDTIDGLVTIMNIDTTYDPNLNSMINTDYYGKLPSQKNRSLQEYSLASEFEKSDSLRAKSNLEKMGLYQLDEAWQTKSGANFSIGESNQDEAKGNLLQKMLNIANNVKKKLSSVKNMVTALSEVGSKMGDGILLKGYMAYSLSNRMNYDSGSSLVGKSYASCGGLAKTNDQLQTSQMIGKQLDEQLGGLASSLGAFTNKNYSFCGAELEYVMFGAMNEFNNQKAAFGVLSMVNALLSLPAICSSTYVEVLKETAVIACAGFPVLSAAMTVIVPAVCALANGTIDAILLVNGSDAKFVKTNDDLNITPAGIAKVINKLSAANVTDAKTMETLKKANKKINKNSDADNSNGNGPDSNAGSSSSNEKKDNDKPLISGSKYWDSVRSWNYTQWMTFILILLWQDEEGMLNRFVDIIQMEQTNRTEPVNNTNYTLEEQISGKKKKFDVDKAYTMIRTELDGKFVNVLPVPTLSRKSVWSVNRVIYRGY